MLVGPFVFCRCLANRLRVTSGSDNSIVLLNESWFYQIELDAYSTNPTFLRRGWLL